MLSIGSAAGVELIIDDSPEAVTLSSFDPVRREIARLSLTKLITDGRIHPARIEEIVAKTKEEVDAFIEALVPAVERLREFSPLREGKYFAHTDEDDHHHDIPEDDW